MIMIEGDIGGKKYTEPFSKGVLSRSLTRAEMGPNKAYSFASEIEQYLLENNIELISVNDLVDIVNSKLEKEDKIVAEKYTLWRHIRKKKEPLIILIGGASGVGTSSIAFEIASRLGIRNMISTDMIREVMRKMLSKELLPSIHESSFTAYKSVRTPISSDMDEVLVGFRNHISAVSVGVEAVIERSLKEGISIVIEGVHIVPGFIKPELMNNDNVVIFVLTVSDEGVHRGRFYSRCRDIWTKRPLEKYMNNLWAIRRTHNFIEDQALKNKIPIIENIDVITTIDYMIKYITKKRGEEINAGKN